MKCFSPLFSQNHKKIRCFFEKKIRKFFVENFLSTSFSANFCISAYTLHIFWNQKLILATFKGGRGKVCMSLSRNNPNNKVYNRRKKDSNSQADSFYHFPISTNALKSGTPSHTRKTTSITRIAVRETSVSRHIGGPIEGPLKSSTHSCNIVL